VKYAPTKGDKGFFAEKGRSLKETKESYENAEKGFVQLSIE
jgi:hypothetical protein